MKKFVFVNISPLQKKINYSLAAAGSLGILYIFIPSVAVCSVSIMLGGTIALKYIKNPSYGLNKLIKFNLECLIKNNGLYNETDKKITYCPELYYDFDEKYISIKIRLDGGKYRDTYTSLENSLQDLFIMECVSKEQIEGHIIYKLDRLSTERINIAAISSLESDLIPINSKIAWNFRKCPHALITGVTGKGKSYFLAYLIKMFTLLKADIKILDPKMSDLYYLECIYHDNVVSSPGQIAQVLRETTELMNERYQSFKTMPNYGFGRDFKDYNIKPIFILFDEMAAFMAAVDKKIGKEVEDYLAEIVMKGRQAGVFMLLTTQRPDADVIRTAIRDQLGLRIALGEMSKTAYSMVFGSEFKDLELNNSTPGNGFIMIDGVHTKPVKFQSPLFNQDYNLVSDLWNIAKRG